MLERLPMCLGGHGEDELKDTWTSVYTGAQSLEEDVLEYTCALRDLGGDEHK